MAEKKIEERRVGEGEGDIEDPLTRVSCRVPERDDSLK